MKYILIMIAFSISTFSYGYDSRKCNQYLKKYFFLDRWLVSSSSFTTSTGDCAAIGYHSKENKKLYFVQNELELQLDIAKGDGAYLTGLSSIYGCSNTDLVNKTLMKNYQSIYKSEKPSNAIDSIMQTQNCKYL